MADMAHIWISPQASKQKSIQRIIYIMLNALCVSMADCRYNVRHASLSAQSKIWSRSLQMHRLTLLPRVLQFVHS